MRCRRQVVLATAFAASAAAQAQTVDLVIHNGFEDCWSQALTQAQFLSVLQGAIEGRTACIAQNSGSFSSPGGTIDYTACYTAACPGSAIGCPVTVHSGAFGGDFTSGAFSASGSADDVAIPVSYSGAASGTCTITVSSISLTYSPYFFISPDGNNGDYMAYLTASSTTTINSDSFSSPDLFCNLAISSVQSQVNTQAQTVATNEMVTDLSAAAAGASVCPLGP
jgi:hypothetical protein